MNTGTCLGEAKYPQGIPNKVQPSALARIAGLEKDHIEQQNQIAALAERLDRLEREFGLHD